MGQDVREDALISVIVPVYNGQDYLKKCIDNIEKQTYTNLEVIIINDGSSDRTGEVCRELADAYENVRIIQTDDEGVSTARNAGLDQMRGEFAAFVDADDRLLPDTIGLLYDCIVKTHSDIAGCSFFAWKMEEEILDNPAKEGARDCRIYSAAEFLKEGILNGNSRCWSKLYRSAAIGNLRFRKEITIGEDMLFLVDLLPKIKRVAEISYKGYGYFQNPSGAMNRKFLPRYMDQIKCWEIAREELERPEAAAMYDTPKEKEQIKVRVTAILIMAVMLTAGKLAMLTAGERKQQEQYTKICSDKIKKEIQVPGAYEALSKGYKVKVVIFKMMPRLYLGLYHFWKR